jgi:hypothetical protein
VSHDGARRRRLEDVFARSRERAARYEDFLVTLRQSDPAFGSPRRFTAGDMAKWQAAVYLLTGCEEVWSELGAAVLAERSIGRVSAQLDKPRRP